MSKQVTCWIDGLPSAGHAQTAESPILPREAHSANTKWCGPSTLAPCTRRRWSCPWRWCKSTALMGSSSLGAQVASDCPVRRSLASRVSAPICPSGCRSRQIEFPPPPCPAKSARPRVARCRKRAGQKYRHTHWPVPRALELPQRRHTSASQFATCWRPRTLTAFNI